MSIKCYYVNNNSFHGVQISNLNTQVLFMHFVIIFSQLFNSSVKPNIRFLIKTPKLSILLTAYMVLALFRGGNFSMRRYTSLKATLSFSGVSRISFRGGGFKIFLKKWGYLHGAKRHAFVRGVRGHAPRENF